MRLGFIVLAALAASAAHAQTRAVTIDDLYDPHEKSRHGVVDPLLVKHMRQTMLDFTLETLLRPRPAAATTDAGQDRR